MESFFQKLLQTFSVNFVLKKGLKGEVFLEFLGSFFNVACPFLTNKLFLDFPWFYVFL